MACEAFATDQVLGFADSLFDQKNYEEAITEYKRFIFFHPEDDEEKSYAFYKIGLSYREDHKWMEAIDTLRVSIQTTDNEYLKDERRITLATTLIAKGDYNLAQLELLKVSCFSQDSSLRLKALYFQGITHIYTFNWEGAQEAFREFYSNSELKEKEKILHLLSEARDLPYKSPKLAKMLSTLLPGSGQLYARDLKNSINAFLLNGLTTAILLKEFSGENYLNASLIFLELFWRYYQGNRYCAEKVVIDYNHRLNYKQAEKILQILK
ncbi:tetratricopeptide repeat protein [bacterium]|nr:tetratricopeptide repeat protein [bacterium]MBU1599957.1 tetratricopeptide repeat protein [bacterium]